MSLSFCTVSTFARSSSSFGGSENQLIQIQDQLIKEDNRLIHIHVNTSNKILPFHELSDNFETYNINVNYNNPLWEISAFIKVISLFKNELKSRVDVIYTRGSYLLFPLFFIQTSYNIPVIYVPTGISGCYTLFQNVFRGKFKRSHVISRLIGDFVVPKLNTICLTNEQKLLIKDNLNIRATLIPNGHPDVKSNFQKTKFPLIIWIGNDRPVKRLDIFLDLVESSYNKKAIYVCAGKISPSSLPRIKKIETKYPNFRHFGKLSPEDCNNLISKSSVLVNTSDSEGFSNTFIQAWIRGVPVVSLNSNPSKIITENSLGFFANSNKNTLSNKLSILIKNTDLREKIGKKARTFSKDNLLINLTVSKLINYSKKIISGNVNRTPNSQKNNNNQ